MHRNEAGKRILDGLMIDRFIIPEDSWYDNIRSLPIWAKHEGMDRHAVSKPQE